MQSQIMQSKVEEVLLDIYPRMYRLAYSYVRNEDDAMDIIQESSYKCICNAAKIKNEEYIQTWIWRIVINTALDWKRKQKDHIELDELPERGHNDTYRDTDLYKALDNLKKKEQCIIRMYYFEGFTLEKISKILKMNLNSVKSTYYRSLKKLKSILSEMGNYYE